MTRQILTKREVVGQLIEAVYERVTPSPSPNTEDRKSLLLLKNGVCVEITFYTLDKLFNCSDEISLAILDVEMTSRLSGRIIENVFKDTPSFDSYMILLDDETLLYAGLVFPYDGMVLSVGTRDELSGQELRDFWSGEEIRLGSTGTGG